MLTRIFYYFVLVVICKTTYGSEKIIYLDGNTYISLGFSDQNNEVLANADACNSARRELMSFVFGSGYEINQNMIKSMGTIEYSQDVTTNSGKILLRSVQTEISRKDNVTKCTLKYPKLEAEIEKERAKNVTPKSILHFSETGSSSKMRSGNLELISIPEEADVYIDNIRWGMTPLKLNSMLEPGKHLIRLDHRNYKTEEVEITVAGINKILIKKILKQATAKLNIVTEPEGAKIKLNDVEIGVSPMKDIEVNVGQKLSLNIVHDETETYDQEIELAKDETKTLDLKLILKPSFASFNVSPFQGVTITSDNQNNIPLNMFYPIGPGAHKIEVRKLGYETKKMSVYLKGGQTKAIPTIYLEIQKPQFIPEVAKEEKYIAPVSREEIKKNETQFAYRPVNHDHNKIPFNILPISMNRFSHNKFSTGFDARIAALEIKYGKETYDKSCFDMSINEMFWPTRNDNYSIGIGLELNYRTVYYKVIPSSESMLKPDHFKDEQSSALGGVLVLQIPLGKEKNDEYVYGLEVNFRRMDFKRKLDNQSIGIYFEY